MKSYISLLVFVLSLCFSKSASAQSDEMIKTPLTFEVIEDGTITFNSPKSSEIYYKIDDEPLRIADENKSIKLNVLKGQQVQLWGNNATFNNTFGGTAICYVYGNVMSLLSKDDFETMDVFTEENKGAFSALFKNNTKIRNHKTKDIVLPAKELVEECYWEMFRGCTGLTRCPELPATTLAKKCYSSMFYDCSEIAEAPELPATTLANSCYQFMFYNCTSLISAPELPATKLDYACYFRMFQGCYNMINGPSSIAAESIPREGCAYMFLDCKRLKKCPKLPSTSLSNKSYYAMFYGCTSLTESPVLPAIYVPVDCYLTMFSGCSSLKIIVCLATGIATNINYHENEKATQSWVYNVASEGTFYKSPDMNNWDRGNDGIPTGWTVLDYDVTSPEIKKLEKPTISIQGNRIVFGSETGGVKYHYTITNADVKTATSSNNAVDLKCTYVINVFTSKEGYNDSDIATKEFNISSGGDINGDGIINVADIVEMIMHENQNKNDNSGENPGDNPSDNPSDNPGNNNSTNALVGIWTQYHTGGATAWYYGMKLDANGEAAYSEWDTKSSPNWTYTGGGSWIVSGSTLTLYTPKGAVAYSSSFTLSEDGTTITLNGDTTGGHMSTLVGDFIKQ